MINIQIVALLMKEHLIETQEGMNFGVKDVIELRCNWNSKDFASSVPVWSKKELVHFSK